MNDITTKFDGMSDDELFDLLRKYLGMSVVYMIASAKIIGELESRGRKVPDDQFPIVHYLRKINGGLLAPELFLAFFGKFPLLTRAGRLPLSDQRRVAEDEVIDVVCVDGNGTFTATGCKPSMLETKRLDIVFAPDHIRSVEEQTQILRARQLSEPHLAVDDEIKFDLKRQCMIVGNIAVPLEKLKRAVQKLDR